MIFRAWRACQRPPKTRSQVQAGRKSATNAKKGEDMSITFARLQAGIEILQGSGILEGPSGSEYQNLLSRMFTLVQALDAFVEKDESLKRKLLFDGRLVEARELLTKALYPFSGD